MSKLAYGFPLIIFIASKIVGPFYAYLVNIPILVVFLSLFYLFCKTLLVNSKWSYVKITTFALLSMACLLLLNHRLIIITLSMPYRDPLAFIFMLLSVMLVIKYVASSCRTHYLLSISGFVLALAVSCRETTGLIILPLFIYLSSNWYKNRDVSYIKDGVRFSVFLV